MIETKNKVSKNLEKALQELTESPEPPQADGQTYRPKYYEDLADTINATNERLGIAVHWEHRSFKEQGIDRGPTA